MKMEIVLSVSAKRALSGDAVDIRIFVEACESLPYTTCRESAERSRYVQFLKYAKNTAVCLDALSRFRGDVSFLLPAAKVEIHRALARCECMPDGGLAGRLRSRLLCARERLAAIDEGER